MIAAYQHVKRDVFQADFSEWLTRFSAMLITGLCFQEISLALSGIKRNAISMAFILLVFIFYFSHVLLLAIHYNYGTHYNDFAVIRYGEDVYIQSMDTTIDLVMALYYGLLSASFIGRRGKQKREVRLSGVNALYLGIIIICLTTPFFIVGAIRFFFSMSVYGYAYAASHAGYSVNTYAFMRMSLVGFVLCLLSCKKEKNARKLIFAASVLYFLAMFSGQRAYNLLFIITLFLVYFIRYKNMHVSAKTVFAISAGLFLLIETINIIRNTRAAGMDLSLLRSGFTDRSSNPVLDLLREFGITENAAVYTWMNQIKPVGGMQLFTSFLTAVPGVSRLFSGIRFSSYNVTDALDMWNFGGGIIPDVIFDFGKNAYWACFLLGVGLQKFYELFLSTIYRRRELLGAFLSPLLCEAVFCIRSTAYKIPRLLFLYGLLFIVFMCIYLLLSVFCKMSRNKEV